MKERHKDILEYIKAYVQAHGYPPSRREIGNGVGLCSTASVQTNVERMIELGILETDSEEGCSRALRIPGYRFVKDQYGQ